MLAPALILATLATSTGQWQPCDLGKGPTLRLPPIPPTPTEQADGSRLILADDVAAWGGFMWCLGEVPDLHRTILRESLELAERDCLRKRRADAARCVAETVSPAYSGWDVALAVAAGGLVGSLATFLGLAISGSL